MLNQYQWSVIDSVVSQNSKGEKSIGTKGGETVLREGIDLAQKGVASRTKGGQVRTATTPARGTVGVRARTSRREESCRTSLEE
jgi:hypothetical protein